MFPDRTFNFTRTSLQASSSLERHLVQVSLPKPKRCETLNTFYCPHTANYTRLFYYKNHLRTQNSIPVVNEELYSKKTFTVIKRCYATCYITRSNNFKTSHGNAMSLFSIPKLLLRFYSVWIKETETKYKFGAISINYNWYLIHAQYTTIFIFTL